MFTPVLHANEPQSSKESWTGPFQMTNIINPLIYRIESVKDPSNIRKSACFHRLNKNFFKAADQSLRFIERSHALLLQQYHCGSLRNNADW